MHEAPIARVCSPNPMGHFILLLWFAYEEGAIVVGTQDMTNKIRNIKQNPNVTVLIDVEGPPLRGVLIYGTAELDYENVVEKRIIIFEKYMHKESARQLAENFANRFKPVIVRVKSTCISSYDYAKDILIQIGSVDRRFFVFSRNWYLIQSTNIKRILM
jgi:hypothetical protein